MRISAIELRLIELPLVRPFRTSFGTEHVRETLLVRVETPDSEGWGECGADVEPLYSSEFNGAAWTVLEQFFVPRLVGANDVAAIDVAPMLRAFKGHRMAKSAVEMAVLDAELRAEGRSLQDYLGGSGDRVAPGVSVGMTDTVEELLGVVSQHREEGYCRIKLKIEPGFDIEPVRRVRSLLGEGYLLQVDANTAYSRSDGRHLAQLDEFGLLLIEQPLDEEDVVGHAELARQLSTRICLDESILSAQTAADAITLGACRVVNIKAGRVGGYLEARRIHDVCLAAGVPVWCGGMLETGIGRAANLALATLPGFSLPGDISATNRYFHEDITAPFLLEEGTIAVPQGPGIGVEVDRQALDRLTKRALTQRHER
ncbi:MAG: o-succinylbenzoate synthase [Acidimicrobiales bacterium]|jgi:O-succinylbenzoate synthase